jgi:polyisoprenyl-phosphate glycosyltransferase
MNRAREIRQADFAAEVQLSVVAPCFNEATGLREFHARVSAACAGFPDHEIVLVDDGSKDATWPVICALTKKDPHVRGIRLSRNFGHQAALTAGLMAAGGARILMIDADLQDPPELLPEMMKAMDAGADVVYGKRTSRRGESVFKRVTAAAFYRVISRLSEVDIPVDTGDFRLVDRRVLDALLSMPERYRFVRGMVAWIGFKQVPLEYVRNPRFAGTTNYTLARMIKFSMDAITGFSTVPHREPVLPTHAQAHQKRHREEDKSHRHQEDLVGPGNRV